MRSYFLVLILIPSVAAAQSQSQPQSQAAQPSLQRPMDAAPPPLEMTDDAVVPLAGKDEARILSKNEAYNLSRVADGRLGVRLGNDMSFRITGN